MLLINYISVVIYTFTVLSTLLFFREYNKYERGTFNILMEEVRQSWCNLYLYINIAWFNLSSSGFRYLQRKKILSRIRESNKDTVNYVVACLFLEICRLCCNSSLYVD